MFSLCFDGLSVNIMVLLISLPDICLTSCFYQLRNTAHAWHAALILSVYIFSCLTISSDKLNAYIIIILYSIIIADVNICTCYNLYSLWIICYSAVVWPVMRYRYIQCSTVSRFFRSIAHLRRPTRSIVPHQNRFTVPRTQVQMA